MKKALWFIWGILTFILQKGETGKVLTQNVDGSMEGKGFLVRQQRDVQYVGKEEHQSYRRVKRAGASNSLTEVQKKEALDVHNIFRGQVANSENASNMNYLTWNNHLADQAQEWANNCDFEHSEKDDVTGYGYDYPNYGENLYFRGQSGTTDPSYTITHALTRFFDEKPNYYYETQNCTKGICGHYTQLVWGDSREVGCAWAYCSNIQETKTKPPEFTGYGPATYFVCMYTPAGNVVGFDPFMKGSALCSDCQTEQYSCYKGLCRNCSIDGVQDECVCKAGYACSTDHCSGAKSDCTCDCKTPYYGTKCYSTCSEDPVGCSPYTTDYCIVPDYKASMESLCPHLCSVCNLGNHTDACEGHIPPTLPPAFPFYKWDFAEESTTSRVTGVDQRTSDALLPTTTSDVESTRGGASTSSRGGATTTSSTPGATTEPKSDTTTVGDSSLNKQSTKMVTDTHHPSMEGAGKVSTEGVDIVSTKGLITTSPLMTTTQLEVTTTESMSTPFNGGGPCGHWYCLNGGEVNMWKNTCKCKCTDQWQGQHCKEYRKHHQHGVKVKLFPYRQIFKSNEDFRLQLYELIPNHLNDKCNKDAYFERCCTNVQKKDPNFNTFITKSDLFISPQPSQLEDNIRIILIYVIIPNDSALCNHGNANGRKRRSLKQTHAKRLKRETSEEYLSQDVLYEVMLAFKDNISETLQDCCNLTILSIEKGVLEESVNNEDPYRFPVWAIVVAVFAVLFLATVVFVIRVNLKEKKKKATVVQADEQNGNVPKELSPQSEAETVKL